MNPVAFGGYVIRPRVYTVKQVADALEQGLLTFDAKKIDSSSYESDAAWLIETMLSGIPFPPIYLRDSGARSLEVVRGSMLVRVIDDFVLGKVFGLKRLEYFTDLEGLRFDQIPFAWRRKLMETKMLLRVFSPGTSPEALREALRQITRLNELRESL